MSEQPHFDEAGDDFLIKTISESRARVDTTRPIAPHLPEDADPNQTLPPVAHAAQDTPRKFHPIGIGLTIGVIVGAILVMVLLHPFAGSDGNSIGANATPRGVTATAAPAVYAPTLSEDTMKTLFTAYYTAKWSGYVFPRALQSIDHIKTTSSDLSEGIVSATISYTYTQTATSSFGNTQVSTSQESDTFGFWYDFQQGQWSIHPDQP